MCTSTPSIPAATMAPPPPAVTDPSIQASAEAERRRQAAQRYQTLLTQGQGAGTAGQTPAAPMTPAKSLIGG